jgi:hypothetical protein
MSGMFGHVLPVLGGWLLGLLTAVPLLLRRRRATAPQADAQAALPAEVREAVTEFGEELAALPFDPAGPEAVPAVLGEYRQALDAYQRATLAGTAREVAAALRTGRAALIRLEARQAGRPVPIDALPPAEPAEPAGPTDPVREEGVAAAVTERYVIAGSGPGTSEHLVDRPEPGRHALLEAVNRDPDGSFFVETVSRTEDRVRTLDLLVSATGRWEGVRMIGPEATHLRVERPRGGPKGWRIRVRPLSEAPVLDAEWRGSGCRVLRHDGVPALLTVQIRSGTGWTARFVCHCLRGNDCRCREPRRPAGLPTAGTMAFGRGDGRETMWLPRPGFVTLSEGDGAGEWYLTLKPVEPATAPARRKKKGKAA